MDARTLSIIAAICAYTAGASAQLGSIFSILPQGTAIVNLIVGIAGFVGGTLGVVNAILNGQSGQLKTIIANKNDPEIQTALVKTVASYPGVEPIQTNRNASEALKSVAADNNVDKVLPPK